VFPPPGDDIRLIRNVPSSFNSFLTLSASWSLSSKILFLISYILYIIPLLSCKPPDQQLYGDLYLKDQFHLTVQLQHASVPREPLHHSESRMRKGIAYFIGRPFERKRTVLLPFLQCV